jgi:hypothetical protein
LLGHYLCHQQLPRVDHSLPNLVKLDCDSHPIVSTTASIPILTPETFSIFHDMVRALGLKSDDTVWVMQAGWDVDLASQLKSRFAQFHDLQVESFGRNIVLFKLKAGQPVPGPVSP